MSCTTRNGVTLTHPPLTTARSVPSDPSLIDAHHAWSGTSAHHAWSGTNTHQHCSVVVFSFFRFFSTLNRYVLSKCKLAGELPHPLHMHDLVQLLCIACLGWLQCAIRGTLNKPDRKG